MRVLMVQSFLHARGGDTTCAALMGQELGRLDVDVVPFAMRHPDNDPSTWETRFPPWRDAGSAHALTRVRAVAGSIWSLRAARALGDLIRAARPDVAHVHHVHRHLTPSILWPLRRAGVPVVWTVHDYELVCPAGTLHAPIDPPGVACDRCRGLDVRSAVALRCKRGDPRESMAFAAEKFAHAALGVHARVDRFVAPSRFLADRLAERGIPAARIRHLPNGVALGDMGPRPAADAPIVFAGRLAPEKGLDDVLAVARLLPTRRFRLLGSGPDEARLRRDAPPNVTLLGSVDADTVARELRAAAVVLVPSRWPENDPYAVIEAQMAGRVVIASAVGGIPEQVRHRVDGLLVPPGDVATMRGAIEEVLADPARAYEIGAEAHRRVRAERAPDAWGLAIRELYRELLN
jgi:glycosyltransferase involved in cell wall biosynthesis